MVCRKEETGDRCEEGEGRGGLDVCGWRPARLRDLERDLTRMIAGILGSHPEVTAPDVDLAARIVIDTIESLVHRIATDATSGIADDVLADEITRLVVAYLTVPV